MTTNGTADVADYLDDVARMLSDLDPADRAEVLAGLREHLDASLGPAPGPAELHRVLAELGPPEEVAREAIASLGERRPSRALPVAPPRVPLLARRWVPGLVVVLLIGAMVLALLVLTVGVSFVTVTSEGGATPVPSPSPGSGFQAPGEELDVVVEERSLLAGSILTAILFPLPLWLTAGILLVLSPLFAARVTIAGFALVPGTLLLTGAIVALAVRAWGSAATPWAAGLALAITLAAAALTVAAILLARPTPG